MNDASPRRILWMVCVLHAATHLYTSFLQPLNGDLKTYFGLTLDVQLTRIPALYLICYAGANFVCGLLVNRIEPRTLLAVGPLLNGAAVMALALLRPDQYSGLLILVSVGAFGGGLYHPVANLLITSTFPTQRGKALGLVGIGAAVAFIGGPWFGSALVRGGVCSWQAICAGYGALGIAAGLAAWFALPAGFCETSLQARAHNPRESTRLSEGTETRSVLLFALLFLCVLVGREIASWGVTATTQQFVRVTYGPPPATGFDPTDPGFLLALIFVPGLFMQPLAGRWSDRVGRERVLAFALLGMAGALLLFPLMPRAWIWLPYVLLGAAMTSSVPTAEALLADRSPQRLRGLVFGIVITAGFGSGSLGPLLVGTVADAGGRTPLSYAHGFWAMSGLALVSFALALTLNRAARRLNVDRFHHDTPAAAGPAPQAR